MKHAKGSFGRTIKRLFLVAVLLSVGLVAVVITTQPDLRWRAKVVQLKLSGELPDVEFFWLLKMLAPGSPIYLESLVKTGNPYASIRNPHTSEQDVEAGGGLFQSHCASCHSGDAHGAALSLFDSNFTSGDSDWAIFRNTLYGIEGTAMPAMDLAEQSVWQIIAYMREQSRIEAGESAASAIPTLDPVTFDRILHSSEEPQNWLSYSGALDGQRFSLLDQLTRSNVSQLKLAWVYQGRSHDYDVESTPIVSDGVLITTEPPGSVLALDAESGEVLWRYDRNLPGDLRLCCGPVNRGAAVGESSVFLGTLDAHLVALDIQSGRVIWDAETAEHSDGYSNTAAPMVVKDSVLVGVAGGEFGIRGFVDAYDIESGERKWRFYTIPEQSGSDPESWADDSWRTGGGPTWMTGTYDGDTNLTFWGVGNPGPDFNSTEREGDNLYTNSVVALDADTGALKWHFQFTPEDVHDYDANMVPVIAELPIDGVPTKVVMCGTKNGFFYVLDAKTGQYISAIEITQQTWAKGIDENGRPIRDPESTPKPAGTRVYPGAGGGANWWPPSFNPDLNTLYLPVLESGSIYFSSDDSFESGSLFLGGSSTAIPAAPQYTALRAIDPVAGEILWESRGATKAVVTRTGGTFATTTGLEFWGDGAFLHAFDGSTGEMLWKANVGGRILSAPMTYAVNGKQYVAVSAGRGLFVFSL